MAVKSSKIPKWQTDPDWALRRAKRKRERLSPEVEKLFKGKPEHCLAYANALGGSLSAELITSVCDHFRELLNCKLNNPARLNVAQKLISAWIMNYVNSKGELTPELDGLFIDVSADHISSPYDWGSSRCLKMAQILGNKISADLEDLIWSHSTTALDYSEATGKRIPEQFEIEHLKKADSHEFLAYVQKVFKGRAPENIELEVLTNNPALACDYAENVMHGKLPEAIHSSIIMHSFGNTEDEDKSSIIKYIDFIKLTKDYATRVLEEFDESETVGNVLKKLKNNDK